MLISCERSHAVTPCLAKGLNRKTIMCYIESLCMGNIFHYLNQCGTLYTIHSAKKRSKGTQAIKSAPP